MRTAALLVFAGWSVSVASAADPVAPAPIVLQPGQVIIMAQPAAAPATAPCTTCGDSAVAKKPGFLKSMFKKPACAACDDGSAGGGGILKKILKRIACPDGKCGEKGCNNPQGCGNLYTECKFLFGGCRDFFGTDAASAGHLHRTVTP